jgi:hypothetical protein
MGSLEQKDDWCLIQEGLRTDRVGETAAAELAGRRN